MVGGWRWFELVEIGALQVVDEQDLSFDDCNGRGLVDRDVDPSAGILGNAHIHPGRLLSIIGVSFDQKRRLFARLELYTCDAILACHGHTAHQQGPVGRRRTWFHGEANRGRRDRKTILVGIAHLQRTLFVFEHLDRRVEGLEHIRATAGDKRERKDDAEHSWDGEGFLGGAASVHFPAPHRFDERKTREEHAISVLHAKPHEIQCLHFCHP
jgi:hypothetical protein